MNSFDRQQIGANHSSVGSDEYAGSDRGNGLIQAVNKKQPLESVLAFDGQGWVLTREMEIA